MQLDWTSIDARVGDAVGAFEEAAAEMATSGEAAPCPLESFRDVSTKSVFLDLREGADNEWSESLAAWVCRLTIERVTWPDRARLDAAWAKAPEPRAAREVRHAPREVFASLLGEAARPGRRAALAEELSDSGSASDAARILAERRVEAIRRMDPPASSSLLPFGDPLRLSFPDVEAGDPVRAGAEAFLDRTDAMLESEWPGWDAVLPDLLATDATEGWPASLTMRWVTGHFAGTPLLEGIRLPALAMPRPLGAMSFALALARLGQAVVTADASRSAPFALRRPVVDLRGPRRAVELGSLIGDRSFTFAALGLSRHGAANQIRKVGRAMLLDARLRAARVLLDGVATKSTDERATLFEGWTRRAWGVPLPAAVVGLVPRLGPADELAWVGLVAGLADRQRDIQRFDEDWFRNPAAARALRERDGSLPPTRHGRTVVTGVELSASVDAAVSFFEETLA